MKTHRTLTLVSSLSLLALSAAPSPAIVIVLSDLVPAGPGGSLESFLNSNFTNVTEIRHGNYANFAAAETQDALNGTGAFAGNGPADLVIIGRSLSSGDYDAGDSDGYNALTIPMVNFTSYTARTTGNRLGWHGSAASTDKVTTGVETTVTLAGSAILGLGEGTYDLVEVLDNSVGSFNGLAIGTVAFGGGDVLATIGGDTLAAYWDAGDAPGDTVSAGVPTFPAPRLLFNLDNDPNAGNDGLNDLNNLTPLGTQALISALDFATPLVPVPEPSSAFLGLAGAGLLAFRRRR